LCTISKPSDLFSKNFRGFSLYRPLVYNTIVMSSISFEIGLILSSLGEEKEKKNKPVIDIKRIKRVFYTENKCGNGKKLK
jgi:hypothetical protein